MNGIKEWCKEWWEGKCSRNPRFSSDMCMILLIGFAVGAIGMTMYKMSKVLSPTVRIEVKLNQLTTQVGELKDQNTWLQRELSQVRQAQRAPLVLQPNLAFRQSSIQTIPVSAAEWEFEASSFTGFSYRSRGRTGTIITR